MVRKNPNRTAVSNGTKLLPGQVDGRSRFARRYRDLVQDISNDLGGAARLSVLQHQLVRRAAALAARCEMTEADLAAGRAIDSERFASDVALLVRVGRQLGLNKVAQDASGPLDLRDYLARQRLALQPEVLSEQAEQDEAAPRVEDGSEPQAPSAGAPALECGETVEACSAP